ncbi:hypothetical protein Flavo103_44020 [Flavobacterium collinsii]|nr:hypothetical protein Flavo103_44020 [Flavobacterium collinsii]
MCICTRNKKQKNELWITDEVIGWQIKSVFLIFVSTVPITSMSTLLFTVGLSPFSKINNLYTGKKVSFFLLNL